MHTGEASTNGSGTGGIMAAEPPSGAHQAPRAVQPVEHTLALCAAAVLAEAELCRCDPLLQLRPCGTDLHCQARAVEAAKVLGPLAGDRALQAGVVHQIHHQSGERLSRDWWLQAEEWCPVACPAAHEAEIDGRQIVGASEVKQQQRDGRRHAMRAAGMAVERVGDRQRCDAPLLGAGVVSQQVQPQTCRQLLAGTEVLGNRHARVVDAAMQDQCQALGVRRAVGRALQLCAVAVGARRLEPGCDHLPECLPLVAAEGQRFVRVAPCEFFLDEAKGDPCLLKELQVHLRGRRALQQAVEEVVDLVLGTLGVGQGKAGKELEPTLQIGDFHPRSYFREGCIHDLLSFLCHDLKTSEYVVR